MKERAALQLLTLPCECTRARVNVCARAVGLWPARTLWLRQVAQRYAWAEWLGPDDLLVLGLTSCAW